MKQAIELNLADKTNVDLLGIVAQAADWRPEVVESAKLELQKRGVDISAALSQYEAPTCKGVGGWLLFLCLVLTVVAPLLNVCSVISSWNDYTDFFVRSLHNRFTIVLVLSLWSGLTIFGIYAGVGLWHIRTGAVRTAKRYLWTYLVYSVAVNFILPGAGDIIRGPIFFLIWYFYLIRSKRVRATYQ